jgi:hypothetical protein
MRNLLKGSAPLVISFSLFLCAPLTIFPAQDYIKESPQLDRLMANSSQRERDQLNKMLSSMPPEARQKYIQGMIELGLKIQNHAIIVERTFAKFQKHPGSQKGLIVRNGLSSVSPAIEPFTPTELAALATLPLNGVLEVAGLGKGGPRGATTQVRIVLIMQNQIQSPVEFALPVEGSLMIVQTDDGWTLIPKEYKPSDNFIRIKPGRPNKTDVEYDDGVGRSGSEVFSWIP